MPFLQTEYKERMAPPAPGTIHGTDNDVFTGIVGYGDSDMPIELPYPRGVRMTNGAGAQPILFADGITMNNFAGITVRDITLLNLINSPDGDVYLSGQNCAVLRRGSIWVQVVGGAAVIGTPASVVAATGQIVSAGGLSITGSRWMTRADEGQRAILHISGQHA